MSKVIITKEQYEFIEDNRLVMSKEAVLKHYSEDWFIINDNPLYNLSFDDLATVLYSDDYKVIPNYKIGEWVTYFNGIEHGWATHKIKDIEGIKLFFGENRAMYSDEWTLRYATQDEIISVKNKKVFESAGREYGVFKKGDILRNELELIYEITNYFGDDYSVEGIPFNCTREFLLENYTVVCFVENREDYEG